MAVEGDAFAHIHLAQHTGDHMQLAPGIHLKHHIAGVPVFIDQMLDGTFHPQQLLFLFHGLCPPFAAPGIFPYYNMDQASAFFSGGSPRCSKILRSTSTAAMLRMTSATVCA